MHKQSRTLLCPSDSVLPLLRTSPVAMAAFVTWPCCEGRDLSSNLWTWGVSLSSGEGAGEMFITATRFQGRVRPGRRSCAGAGPTSEKTRSFTWAEDVRRPGVRPFWKAASSPERECTLAAEQALRLLLAPAPAGRDFFGISHEGTISLPALPNHFAMGLQNLEGVLLWHGCSLGVGASAMWIRPGLAKPMGLVEGPGGLGQGGMAATLRDDSHESETKYEEYGYNAQLSDRISLDRSIPDYRPKKCKQMTYPDDLPQISVVFIFVNEALSVILRSVHSVVNHTPSHLLKEIILVDDNSDNVELKFNLDQYVNKRYPGLVKIVRNNKREGLIRARIQGWKAATSPVVGFFDAHVEFNIGWVEPALTRIKEDRKRIILPAIDNIKYNTFEVQQYANAAHGYNWGLWCMYIIPPQDWLDKGDESAPIRTPAMIGCSFVVDREYFGEIGLLDPGMEVYGGENIELGMRVWQCGGSMEVLPCSRVAHIERTKKPYNNDIDYYAKRNALRAAEVWMDDFKSHVYMAWNIPMANPGVDFGDVSERIALRQRLQCRSFKWYLENVYPEMRVYNNTVTYGEVRNSKASGYCLDQGAEEDDKAILYPCHGMSSQLVRYSSDGVLQLGPLGSTAFLPDSKCLIDDGKGRTPTLKKCEDVLRPAQRFWDFTQNGPIISRDTGRCLEVEMSKDANFGLRLVVQRCSGQKWMIRNWIKHGRH
ncbi:polypeptide N-acetylgalactosaminyltransferase 9 isoform X1 [Numida meleagris]|uniref:polypeptide N-acetylgalactosaminyltransferase 9 isoform X1 n=4 Tax=Numida meleagris TaxID=8996 RepID=UPI000B3DE49B|nr:polypeptide N-acetylgalactosaminyltransferase 9 isoform X1 [Numida meleagris]